MKKSMNAWSVPSETGLEEMFAALHAAGFEGVELTLDAPGQGPHSLTMETTKETLDHIRELSQRYHLPVCGVASSLWGKTTLGAPEGEMPAEALLERQLAYARALGAAGILIVPGGIGENCSIARAWENAQQVLERCRGQIEAGGVSVGVENVWNNFFLSPFEMARFLDELSMKNLNAYFDVGNVAIFSYPEYWIEALGPRIQQVHVKDFQRAGWNAGHFVNLLEGSVRWDKVMAALRAIGYDGFLTAELASMPKTPGYLYEITASALDTIRSFN